MGGTNANDLIRGARVGFVFVDGGCWSSKIRGETTVNGLVGGVRGGFVFVDGGGLTKDVVGMWTEIGRTGTGASVKRGATSHA